MMNRTWLALPVAALLLTTACPGDRRTDESQNSPPKTSTSLSNPKAEPQNSSTMDAVAPQNTSNPTARIGGAAEQTIDVQLTEYEIRMPDTLHAGANRLKVVNAGKENHNFVIEGPGVSSKLANDLTRGDTSEVVVNLQPGQYTVYCPVDGHRGKGMTRTVTVE